MPRPPKTALEPAARKAKRAKVIGSTQSLTSFVKSRTVAAFRCAPANVVRAWRECNADPEKHLR